MNFFKKIIYLKYKKNPFFHKFYTEIQKKPLEHLTFCSFDLETTGLDIKKDEIISIGGIKIKNLKIELSSKFYKVVKPKKEIKKESILIHGITTADIEKALPPEEVIPEFLEYIKGTVLVGYFISFDISILSRYTQEMFGIPVLNPYIDIRDIYFSKLKSRYTPAEKQEEKNLEQLAEEYGIPVEKRHDAFYDSLISALIFTAMAKKDRSIVEKAVHNVL
ncbi:MAG TPA: 3'-5' exonuclease [Persephonella sp.]|nr:3'-5' exonuclease [Persephonella sp.]